jgi:glycogen operon protein
MRRQRSLLATLFLSQGVPMLLGGDEVSRSQQGNNNAYCQDNELSWFDWNLNDQQQELLEFTRGLIAFRAEHPVLRRRRYFEGLFLPGADIKDLTWFKADGTEIKDEAWTDPEVRCMAMRLAGEAIDEREAEGGRISDETLLVLLNAHYEEQAFTFPESGGGPTCAWERLMNTERPGPPAPSAEVHRVGDAYTLVPRALALFRRVEAPA